MIFLRKRRIINIRHNNENRFQDFLGDKGVIKLYGDNNNMTKKTIDKIKLSLREIRDRHKTNFSVIRLALEELAPEQLKDGIRSLDEQSITQSVTTCKRKPKHSERELKDAVHNPHINIEREPANKIVHSYKLYDCSLKKKRT